jgi:hypothetical protein
MLFDLALACFVAVGWVIGDAKRRRIAAWPFVVATVLTGSVGLLAYLIWRGFAAR